MYTYVKFSNIPAKFKIPDYMVDIVKKYSWRWTGDSIKTDIVVNGKKTTISLNNLLKDLSFINWKQYSKNRISEETQKQLNRVMNNRNNKKKRENKMGYIQHHTLCISSCIEEKIKQVYNIALSINDQYCDEYERDFCLITHLYEGITNGYFTFYVIPDGSNEGWEESDIGDIIREEIKEYIESLRYEDGSNSISYAELFYGDDYGHCEIVEYN